MIITAGINVYPEDVTAVIRSMQDVVDAVTFGLNDDVWGERVVSCVQASDENVTIEAVAAHCGTNLSREKLPNKIFIFPDFPRGPAGKVITSEIKELVYSEINNQAVIDPSASIGDQVRRIAARTFKMSFAAVTADTNPESAPGWNSLAHVEFLLDLEQQFGLRLGPREIMLIGSVGDAVRLVENTATMKSNGGDGATAG